jgi:DNA/RNA-binding domain of Phe-tRNA-synthetase-like protein
MNTVTVTSDLRGIVRLGVLAVEGVEVREHDERLDGPLAEAAERVRRAPPDERLAVRAMYRRTGLDPTKRRPSSEALLRRVLRGEPLPRVNSLVDVCNWCSLELQLPYGLYDLDRVDGPVELQMGRPGEQYPGIRKDVVHLDGRMALADRAGAFGNPSADSARTMVTPATTRVLAMIFAPADTPPVSLSAALDVPATRCLQFAGGRETARAIV